MTLPLDFELPYIFAFSWLINNKVKVLKHACFSSERLNFIAECAVKFSSKFHELKDFDLTTFRQFDAISAESISCFSKFSHLSKSILARLNSPMKQKCLNFF